MTVFKGFLKVLNKCKGVVIMYTVMLLFFGAFNLSTSDENNMSFKEEKPDVLIINSDENKGVTKNLIDFIKDNTNIVKMENDEEKIDDALFYRDVNYVIYIPKNYREEFLNNKNPEIKIKKVNEYNSTYANMLLEKYLKVANVYKSEIDDEDKLIEKINNTLNEEVDVSVLEKENKTSLAKATFYYNFANYSILAGAIYVICLVLSSFKKESIRKKTIISSMDYKKYNRILLLSSMLFAFVLWILYVIISFILIKDAMISINGLGYIINSFVFTISALVFALLISNLVSNKNAINGIVNVVALGSSFLCGSFVPVEWLPDFVLKIAHIFPSYYFIQNNELLKQSKLELFSNLSKLIPNILIMLIFVILFIIINNIVTKRKRKIG